MRSRPRDAAPREDWLDRTPLRSQGLGVVCGLATVALLGVGSFVLVNTADGASQDIRMDDLRGFFTHPSIAHAWLYVLVPVFGLYALNAALATWHTLTRKLASGVRAPSAYGPPVIHVSFLLALVAHLVGGVFGKELDPAFVTSSYRALDEHWQARVDHVEVELLPSGMPKLVRAHLDVIRDGGRPARAIVGYNEPLSEGFGARIWLLAEARWRSVAHLRIGGEACVVVEQDECTLAGKRVELGAIVGGGPAGVPAAMVRVTPVSGGAGDVRRLLPGRVTTLADGSALLLEGFEQQQVVALRGRRAPGNPWALASAVLLAIGVVLMGRRLVPKEGG